MYTRPKRIYTNLKRLENYMEGDDVYNSLLIYRLQDPSLETSEYMIKTPYRPDIIAEDFYGSTDYEPFVILQLRCTLDQVTRGRVFNLITKSEIDSILENLD